MMVLVLLAILGVLWVLVPLGVCAGVAWLRLIARERKAHLCRYCDYDCSKNEGAGCPECGAAEPLVRPCASPASVAWAVGVAVAPLLALVMVPGSSRAVSKVYAEAVGFELTPLVVMPAVSVVHGLLVVLVATWGRHEVKWRPLLGLLAGCMIMDAVVHGAVGMRLMLASMV